MAWARVMSMSRTAEVLQQTPSRWPHTLIAVQTHWDSGTLETKFG